MVEDSLRNQPCYDKDGNFIGWFSRSVAMATFVYCRNKDGIWYVLGAERGKEAADFQGYWNCPCGYLDFNETVIQGAVRELYEECGLNLSPSQLEFMQINDSPTENKQNVTFLFRAFILDKTIEAFSFSKELNEGAEVGEIKWIPLEEISNYRWAFGHASLIHSFFTIHS